MHFFETFVISEIVKSYYNSGKPLNLYYYRDIDQKEIDLLIVEDETIYPVEIKKSKNPSDVGKNLNVLNKFKLKVAPMIIACMSEDLIPLNRNIYLCPITKI